jgi:hypothetical protein
MDELVRLLRETIAEPVESTKSHPERSEGSADACE